MDKKINVAEHRMRIDTFACFITLRGIYRKGCRRRVRHALLSPFFPSCIFFLLLVLLVLLKQLTSTIRRDAFIRFHAEMTGTPSVRIAIITPVVDKRSGP